MIKLKLPYYFEYNGVKFKISNIEDEGLEVEYRHEYGYHINDHTPIWFVAENDFKSIYDAALMWVESTYHKSTTIEEFIDKVLED